jgi:transcription elongation GreA/GreB family factor
MNKKEILAKFAERIAADLAVFTAAANAAHEAATHEESKAEDQYDTRGLEASYLAGAQSKRAAELEGLLALYRFVDLKNFGPETPIASTALVELECEGKHHTYLMMPQGGGLHVEHEGKTVQIVTPQAPMGEALMGKRVGDSVEVFVQKTSRDYEILAVW